MRAHVTTASLVFLISTLAHCGGTDMPVADVPGATDPDKPGATPDGGAHRDGSAGPDTGVPHPPGGKDAGAGVDGGDPPGPDGGHPHGTGHLFGSHSFTYAAGTILPTGSTANLDRATADFYDAWKAKYVISACGQGRRYIATSLESTGGGQTDQSITVSEGHGYGMVIAAIMAGHDPEARAIFDGLYAYFRDHPSVHSPDLMAWNQVKGCGNAKDGGDDSATDGDLDIAFGLLLASKQWPSGGSIDYAAEARKVITAIKAKEMNAQTKLALLGDWSTAGDPAYFGTRPSDFMIDHFRAYGAAAGDAWWTGVVDAHYSLVATMQSTASPQTGLLPDFVVNTDTTPKPAKPKFLEGNNDGEYGYNSCRVPWRLGTDYVVSGDARAKTALTKVNTWIRSATNNNATKITGGYHLNGTPLSANLDNTMAFVSPFGVSAMIDASNRAWIDAIWNVMVARAVDDDDYFGNSIKLLSMIVMSGNWWAP
jgi:endo-1,4-beta-D-glucanase Y